MDNAIDKAKSFWQRPEGTTGKIFVLGAAMGGGLLVYKYLPPILAWVEMVLENTIYTAVLGGAALVVTSPLWNSKMRALTGYMFSSAMRAITGQFIAIDPIGIMVDYINGLKKKQKIQDEQLGSLRGVINETREIIQANERVVTNSLKLVDAARKSGTNRAALVLNANKAGRRQESNLTMQTVLAKLERYYKFLTNLREATNIAILDMEDVVAVKTQERKGVLKAFGAFKAMASIIKGDPDKREIFDQTNAYLAEDAARKFGQIEDFMDMSKGMLEGIDLQNKVFEEDAFKRLDALLVHDDDSHLLAAVTDKIVADPLQREKVAVGAGGDDDVSGLFRRKSS